MWKLLSFKFTIKFVVISKNLFMYYLLFFAGSDSAMVDSIVQFLFKDYDFNYSYKLHCIIHFHIF